MSALNAKFLSVTMLLAQLAAGCGSIAGNPKKPSKPDTPPPATVYALPLLDFTLPAEVTGDEPSGLFLAQPVLPGQGQGVLKNWGKRFDRIVRQVNSLSERVNVLLQDDGETGEGNLKFGRKAKAKGLSGQVATLDETTQAATGFSYEAVVCLAGVPTSRLRWSEDAKLIELSRDFKLSTKAGGEDDADSFEWLASVTFAKAEATTMTLAGQGKWDNAEAGEDDGDELSGDGAGMVERAVAERLADGELLIKAVADRYQVAPQDGDYEGDSYLVGRLLPVKASAGTPAPVYSTAFVAYFKNFGGTSGICGGGFDEEATDLWRPDLSSEGPRWCLGRPSSGKRFLTEAALHETLTTLEPIGVVSKKDLAPVALPDGLGCD